MKEETLKYWENHFIKQKESGLTQTEYCLKQNISYKYFSNIKVKIKKITHGNGFVKIPIKIKKDFSYAESLELIVDDKYKIKVHSGFDQNTLKKLIETIGSIS